MKVKSICCIGAGYVGGPTMAVIALKCPSIKVTVVDINHKRINAWNGPLDELPVYEPGLSDIVGEVRGRNLFFSTDIDSAIQESEMIFMAVNTPTKAQGEGAGMAADLQYVESSSKRIAKVAKTKKIVIEKSTLPVRTAEKIKEILHLQGDGVSFEVISNPEFLAEGTAIKDLFKSDRVLIGGDKTPSGQEAVASLIEIYTQWIPKEKILTTNVWSAELAKLASNAMLAQRISSINSLSALCEKTGAKINELSQAVGMDHRIGPKFLRTSVGFGGSCFKKDILNLVYLCKYYHLDEVAEYWLQVVKINDYQKNRFAKKIIDSFHVDEKEKTVGILGWAFKSNTNDSRESPSIAVTQALIAAGIEVYIYDPKVPHNQIFEDLALKNTSKDGVVHLCDSAAEALSKANTIAIITAWDEFSSLDYSSHLVFNGGIENYKGDHVHQIGKNL